MKVLNINKDEYKYIKELEEKKYVYYARIHEKIDKDKLDLKCMLLLQRGTLKIIKYNLDETEWLGNTLIYYKSIDLINTIITSTRNILTVQVNASKIYLEFNDKIVMHEFYKELTRLTNNQKQRRFL
ncbi:hypothetical protein OTK55_06300 [Methanosphaera sp. Vir-13MRS]|uniref:hypothetical protein n=1 Tax=Candidatus Methanosphaera massiliense TaxID=3017187 RepID=UPI0023809058|nr:hypothetical protein [Candidatus Methanosphaera massiliense]MDE4078625.1 hypothetical protein [Candidatus Methanosphaera massiliense]